MVIPIRPIASDIGSALDRHCVYWCKLASFGGANICHRGNVSDGFNIIAVAPILKCITAPTLYGIVCVMTDDSQLVTDKGQIDTGPQHYTALASGGKNWRTYSYSAAVSRQEKRRASYLLIDAAVLL